MIQAVAGVISPEGIESGEAIRAADACRGARRSRRQRRSLFLASYPGGLLCPPPDGRQDDGRPPGAGSATSALVGAWLSATVMQSGRRSTIGGGPRPH